jgi:predicted  nucleic acid-binding Zn-ribbon protein
MYMKFTTSVFAKTGKRIWGLLGFVFLFAHTSPAQEKLGLQNSNFGGTSLVYLNPAFVPIGKNVGYIDILSRNVYFQNNFINYNAPVGLSDWVYGNERVNANRFSQNWLPVLSLDGGSANFYLHNELRFMSFLFPISTSLDRFFSFNMRQRTVMQAVGMDEPLALMARYGINNSKANLFGSGMNQLEYGNKYSTSNGFKLHYENWQEFGFSLSGIIMDSDNKVITAGISPKLIRGMGVAHFSSENLEFSIENGDSVTFHKGQMQFAHSTESELLNPGLSFQDQNNRTTGFGLGLDMGLSIMKKRTARFKKEINAMDIYCQYAHLYNWKFGMSLMDLGFTNHSSNIQYRSTDFSSPKGYAVRHQMLNHFGPNNNRDGFDELNQHFFDVLDESTPQSAFTSYLPAALAIQYDQYVGKKYYVGVNAQKGLKSNSSSGINANDFLAFIPRYESYLFEFALPITYSSLYTDKVNIGFYTKILTAFYIGSDNLGGLLNLSANSGFTGASFYGGISFQIPHCKWGDWTKRKDRTPTETRRNEDIITVNDEVNKEDTDDNTQTEEVANPEEKTNPKDSIPHQYTDPTPTRVDTVFVTDPELARQYGLDCDKKLQRERERNDLLNTELTRATRENEKNSGIIANLNRRINELEKERDVLIQKNNDCNNQQINRQQQNQRQLTETQRKMEDCQNELSQKELTIKRNTTQIEQLELELKRCREDKIKATDNDEIKTLSAKVITLENTIKTLENNQIKLENERNECLNRWKTLTIEVEECQKNLATAQTTITRLERENGEVWREKQALITRIDNLELENRMCRNDIAAHKTTIIALENKLKECTQQQTHTDKTTIANLERRLQAQKDSLNQCVQREKVLAKEWEDCKNKEKATVERLNTQITQLEKRLKEAENNTTNNGTDELSSLKQRLNTVESDLQRAQKEQEKLQQELSLKEVTIKKGRDSLRSALNDLEFCNVQYESVLREFQAISNKLSDMQQQLRSCEQQLKSCQDNQKAPGTSATPPSDDIRNLENKIKSLESDIATLKEEMKAQQAIIDASKNAEQKLKTALNDCEKNIQQAAAKEAGLRENLRNMEKNLDDVRKQLQEEQKKGAELESKLAQSGSQNTQSQNTTDQRELDKLRQKAAMLEEELKQSERNLAQARAEANEWTTKWQQAEAKNDSIQKAHTQLQRQLEECERARKALNESLNNTREQLKNNENSQPQPPSGQSQDNDGKSGNTGRSSTPGGINPGTRIGTDGLQIPRGTQTRNREQKSETTTQRESTSGRPQRPSSTESPSRNNPGMKGDNSQERPTRTRTNQGNNGQGSGEG